jgi:hypothetical protein
MPKSELIDGKNSSAGIRIFNVKDSFAVSDHVIDYILSKLSKGIDELQLQKEVVPFSIEYCLLLSLSLSEWKNFRCDEKLAKMDDPMEEPEPKAAPCDFHSQKRMNNKPAYEFPARAQPEFHLSFEQLTLLPPADPSGSPKSKVTMRTLFSEMGSARTPRRLRMAFLTAKPKTDYTTQPLETPKVEERDSEEMDEQKMERVRKKYLEKQRVKVQEMQKRGEKREVKNKRSTKQAIPKFLTYDNGGWIV